MMLDPTGPMLKIVDDMRMNANGRNFIVNVFYDTYRCFTGQLDNGPVIKIS